MPLAALIRRSPNPHLVYELRPNLDVRFKAHRVTTGAHGFRGAAVADRKPPGTVRILGVGDSHLFGWGVGDDETFLAVLAERLAARDSSVRWEAVNLAVPGYNAAMEVESLGDHGLRLAPDLVIMDWIGNDLDLPNSTGRPWHCRSWRRPPTSGARHSSRTHAACPTSTATWSGSEGIGVR